MNDPRNLLLVVGAAEKRFDDLQWTLKPLVPSMGVGREGRLRSQQTFQVTWLAVCWRSSVRRVGCAVGRVRFRPNITPTHRMHRLALKLSAAATKFSAQ
jgi:hypothetical protein